MGLIRLMDMYSVENNDYLQRVSARVIGRKMQLILKESNDLRILIKSIIEKRHEDWAKAFLAGMEEV